MSATTKARLTLFVGSIAVATITACSTPTAPTAPLELTRVKPASSDSTDCPLGWVVINGFVTCN